MDPQLELLLPTAFRASYLIGNLTKHAQNIDGEAISKELTTRQVTLTQSDLLT